jgi:uncharacterized protein
MHGMLFLIRHALHFAYNPGSLRGKACARGEAGSQMTVHELTTAECQKILRRTSIGRLACARGDQPYVVPLFFSFDGDGNCLYSFSMVGQKIDWMRGNPKVCVEVEEIFDQFRWSTVLVFGRYEELGDSEHDAPRRRRAQELFEQRPRWWLPGAAKPATTDEHAKPVVYSIRIDKLTGRQASQPDHRT